MADWKLEPARDLGLPLGKQLRSLQRENGLIFTALHLTWWSCVRGYLAVWHRLAIRGRENIPREPPFVLVANHASHLDALVLAGAVSWRIRDRLFPIAAGDVFFGSPVATSFAAGMLNALPMWRKRCGASDLKHLRERLVGEPCAYILFPEGTRSRTGAMAPFKPGLGMIVAGTAVPVLPCYLEGCHECLRPENTIPRPRHITLHIGKPMTFDNVSNERAGWRQIAADIEARVRQLSAT